MKIIEAMKRVKANHEKISDLQKKIALNCANLNVETPAYGRENQRSQVNEWLQSCTDLSQENIKLLCAIQRTNLATSVTMTLGKNDVTKTIAEWIWRRREYSKVDLRTWYSLGDRNLKEGLMHVSQDGPKTMITIERWYDPAERDEKCSMYMQENHTINAILEVVNATTDLIES